MWWCCIIYSWKETPKLQADALRDVIGYLESEFINVESFTDVNFKKENLD